MNSATVGLDKTDTEKKYSDIKPVPNRNFKKDLYKKSLQVLNNSSIVLPTVDSKHQLAQSFDLLKEGSKMRGSNESVGELSTNFNLYQNQESSLMTGGGASSIVINNQESSIITETGGHYQTYSLAVDASSGKVAARDMLASKQRGSQPLYQMTHDDHLPVQYNAQQAFQRNQSTMEKPKGYLSVDPANSSSEISLKMVKRGGSVAMDSMMVGGESSIGMMHNLYQSSMPSAKKSHTTGETYQSVKILPVIGSEINILEQPNTTNLNRINSKVELTKKDIQNFLVNGTVSKEFIHSNQKELQRFIRNQARSTDNGLRGYKAYGEKEAYESGMRNTGSTKHNQSIEHIANRSKLNITSSTHTGMEGGSNEDALGSIDVTPSLKRKLLGPATIHVEDQTKKHRRMAGSQQKLRSERLNTDTMTFPNDVKLEKKFKGDGQVSNRVLETWINETLTDAYHLEIPGVLTKPEHKNPIHRYGIDRQTLVNAGVSTEEVDRIYRSLFVYSVGFFELLKKILATTQKNYLIITTIWKVYQVLLEYCCKTDYRILIAEITDKHHQELDNIEKMFKAKIQEKVDTEKVLKQNMETMRDYNDHLEKDRANEKQLRLKLEEEYMQNTKNHEEEVKLRLKFEGKFNTMHDTHRELEIRHDRTLKELRVVQMELKESEDIASVKSNELIDIQRVKVQQDTKIDALTEYKKANEKDMKKKNWNLMTAQQQQAKATEEFELKRYEVQESNKDLNDVKTKMEVQTQEIEHLRGVIQASKLEKEEIELARLKFKGKYQKIKVEFESREGQIAILATDLESNQQSKIAYFEELEPLRKKYITLEKQIRDLETIHLGNVEKRKIAVMENKELTVETELVQDQIKKMNGDRHRLMYELKQKTELSESLENQRDVKTVQISELHVDIQKRDSTFAEFRRDTIKRDEEMEKQKQKLKERVEGLTSDNEFQQIQISQLTNTLNEIEMKCYVAESRGTALDGTIAEQVLTISQLTFQKQEQTNKFFETQKNLTVIGALVANAEQARDDAILDKIFAEEIAKTFEYVNKDLKKQMKEDKERCKREYELVYNTCMRDNERDMMHAEEIISRYGHMRSSLQEAVDEREVNREKISRFDHIEFTLKKVEKYRDEVLTELNRAKDTLDKQDHKLTDKEAEIVHIKDSHIEEFKKQVQEHKIEVNEIEQKLSQQRIANAQQKTETMKRNREDQGKISELQRQVKKLDLNNAPPKNQKGGSPLRKSINIPETEDRGCQTEGTQLAQMLKKKGTRIKSKILSKGHNAIQSQGQESLLNSMRLKTEEKSLDDSSIQLPSTSNEVRSKNNNKSDSGIQIIKSDKESSEEEDDEEESEEEENSKSTTIKAYSSKITTRQMSSHLSVISEDSKRITLYMQWLVDEERKLLQKIEEEIAKGEAVHPNQIKIWRSEQRIPARFLDIKLKQEQLATVEEQQKEQAKQIQTKALRQIEEGSEYSSDFEQIDKSEYISTDGEPDENEKELAQFNIKVVRGSSNQSSIVHSGRGENKINLAEQQRTGEFGLGSQKGSDQPLKIDSSQFISTKVLATEDSERKAPLDKFNIVEPIKQNFQNETRNSMEKSQGSTEQKNNMKVSDKIKNFMTRANSAKARKDAAIAYQHMIDEQIPITQYMLKTNDQGKDVYKRRIVVQARVEKQRSEEYQAQKARTLSARVKREDPANLELKAKEVRVYKNIFSHFAENYSKTLDKLVKQSKEWQLKTAERRQQPGKNENVDNVEGRERHQFLIKQMKESTAWQIHLAKLKEELTQQEGKWDNRDEEKAEIERKREEIRKLEEDADRDRSRERLQKTVVVREDLRIKAMKEESRRRKLANKEAQRQQKEATLAGQESWEKLEPPFATKEQDAMPQVAYNLNNFANEPSQQTMLRNTTTIHQSSGRVQHQMDADLEQLSAWSEDQLAHELSQRDAQNPQGEEEEIKSSELQLILQTSQQQRQMQGILLDQELQNLNKGGVAAINRESQQQRTQIQNQMQEIQASVETRARQKDIVLMQQDKGAKRPEEQKKKPAKLGPSTIRTLIRAADSRKD